MIGSFSLVGVSIYIQRIIAGVGGTGGAPTSDDVSISGRWVVPAVLKGTSNDGSHQRIVSPFFLLKRFPSPHL